MSFKKCGKCGEEAAAAKAFCPECGNPFVEEDKRAEATEFEKNAGTMVFSKTAFNIMLDKMELDTSRAPDTKKEESKEQSKVRIQIENSANNFPSPTKTPDQTKKTGNRKWIIFGALGALFFVFFATVILIGLYFYSNR